MGFLVRETRTLPSLVWQTKKVPKSHLECVVMKIYLKPRNRGGIDLNTYSGGTVRMFF